MAKLERYNTPKCTFKYPFIVTRDVPTRKNIAPKFKITGVFDPKQNKSHAEFLNKITALVTDDSIKIYAKYHPIKKDTEKDENDNPVETGLIAVTFKTDYKPVVFDAKLNPIIREENYIANGSEGYINYSTYEYEPGRISMILNSIQVTNLIEWDNAANADAFGFKEEEGYSDYKPAEDAYAKLEDEFDAEQVQEDKPEQDDLPF